MDGPTSTLGYTKKQARPKKQKAAAACPPPRAVLCKFCSPPTYWAPTAMYYIHKKGGTGKCKKCKHEANLRHYHEHKKAEEWLDHKKELNRQSAERTRKKRSEKEHAEYNRKRRERYKKHKREKFLERIVQVDNERGKGDGKRPAKT